jgi:thiol-disulfide isomerase/thioredoxin
VACNAIKPVVDRLEEELANNLVVVRVNAQEAAGRAVEERYGVRYTPTFIFFDAQGNEVWHSVGSLDAERVRESVGQ